MKKLILLMVFLFSAMQLCFAYTDVYPPYKFSEKPYLHLEAEELVNWDNGSYISEDEGILIYLKDRLYENAYDFYIKENGITLAEYEKDEPFPHAVFRTDLDGNGLKDYVIFSSHRGCGLAAHLVVVSIILKKSDNSYQKITYESFFFGLEDFVDLNKDGKFEVIITDMYGGKEHNYWVYNIYEFDDSRLINANKKYKDFPKFIWYTFDVNDKDTTHLTKEEKEDFIEKVNKSIQYKDIKK